MSTVVRSVRELLEHKHHPPPLQSVASSPTYSNSTGGSPPTAASNPRDSLIRAYRIIRSELDTKDYESFTHRELTTFIERLCDTIEDFERRSETASPSVTRSAAHRTSVTIMSPNPNSSTAVRRRGGSQLPTLADVPEERRSSLPPPRGSIDEHMNSLARLADFSVDPSPTAKSAALAVAASFPASHHSLPEFYTAMLQRGDVLSPLGSPSDATEALRRDAHVAPLDPHKVDSAALSMDLASCEPHNHNHNHHHHQRHRSSSPAGLAASNAELYMSTSLSSNSAVVHRRTLRTGTDGAGFQTLNNYTVLDVIGEGASSQVILVSDALSSQLFAVKKIRRRDGFTGLQERPDTSQSCTLSLSGEQSPSMPFPACASNSASMSDAHNAQVERFRHQQQQQQQRQQLSHQFKREIAIMRKLRHPNLVRLHEVIDDGKDEFVFLVMDYVRGGPIMDVDYNDNVLTPAVEPYTEANARTHFKAIAFAVKYLHKHRISHNDLKFSNTILNENGDPILIDFGVSHQFQRGDDGSPASTSSRSKSAPTPTKFGTPAFFSPQVIEGVPANELNFFAADVWALGVLLFGLLFRRLPFHAASLSELRQKVCSDFLIIPNTCSSEARHLLTQMLCKDDKRRITIDSVCDHPFVRNAPKRSRSFAKVASRRTSTAPVMTGAETSAVDQHSSVRRVPSFTADTAAFGMQKPRRTSHVTLPQLPPTHSSAHEDEEEDNDGFNAPEVSVTEDEIASAILVDTDLAASLRLGVAPRR